MAGRGSGTQGGELAARRIAEWLADAGLRPGGEDGTYFQWFALPESTRLGAGTMLEMSGSPPVVFVAGRDWTPHGGSARGETTGQIAFAGYGVSAPGDGYDDYADVDVRGKIVLVLAGAPPHLSSASTSRLEKIILARSRGAAALLIVSDALPKLEATATAMGLPSGAVKPVVADTLLGSTGRNVSGLRAAIATTRRPASLLTGVNARLRVVMEAQERKTANVIGVLPGTDPVLGGEAVVVGAHYDHLGVVKGVTYPGADDNASGTAVVVGLARAYARAAATRPAARTLVFALFSGEEMGLLGSAHYVSRPLVPIARTVAMLNFDEVGRLREGRLHVGGVDSGAGLRQMVQDAARNIGLTAELQGAPHGPSDHSRFYDGGVPVLFFYTGTHDDYHAPSDTADRINADGMARVAALGARVIDHLAVDRSAPVYAKVPHERPAPRAPAGGAFLGVASHPGSDDGVRLDRVIPDSAAARAGMRAGDVLVRLAGASIESFDGLRAVLRERRPGDVVRLVYVRDGELHEASTTLGEP